MMIIGQNKIISLLKHLSLFFAYEITFYVNAQPRHLQSPTGNMLTLTAAAQANCTHKQNSSPNKTCKFSIINREIRTKKVIFRQKKRIFHAFKMFYHVSFIWKCVYWKLNGTYSLDAA